MTYPLITFTYKTEKDVWCIANKGKSSNNSNRATKVYQMLEAKCGKNPTEADIRDFIGAYLQENDVPTDAYVQKYTDEWDSIDNEYHKRAQQVFNIKLPKSVTAYLTINNRCPYSITENMFYVPFPRESVRKTVMHELWHFYTWYGLGTDQETKLGKEKYNELKEALTVLLNTEYADMLPDGITDEGYPKHQVLRQRILELWKTHKDIRKIWEVIQ
jgi:hypothetical protein